MIATIIAPKGVEAARAGHLGIGYPRPATRLGIYDLQRELDALSERTGRELELKDMDGFWAVYDWSVGDAIVEATTAFNAVDDAKREIG